MINKTMKFEYARIKGGKEWAMLKEGKTLSRKQSMLAMCYECNGFEESGVDCGSKACPIYQFHPTGAEKAVETLLRCRQTPWN